MATTNDRIVQLEETIRQGHEEAWAAYQEIEQLWFSEVLPRLDIADIIIRLHALLHASTSAEETQ